MKDQTPASRPSNAGGKRIPEQARDCGPQVDTWPILDTQADATPRPKPDRRSRRPGGSRSANP